MIRQTTTSIKSGLNIYFMRKYDDKKKLFTKILENTLSPNYVNM